MRYIIFKFDHLSEYLLLVFEFDFDEFTDNECEETRRSKVIVIELISLGWRRDWIFKLTQSKWSTLFKIEQWFRYSLSVGEFKEFPTDECGGSCRSKLIVIELKSLGWSTDSILKLRTSKCDWYHYSRLMILFNIHY